MADRFFIDQPLDAGEFTLDGAEAHHLTGVRRFAVGDAITLFNGDGREFPAVITATAKRSVTVRTLEGHAVSRELSFALTLAVAMPKGDRGEFLVEKLVELGVSRFIPIITDRTIVSPKETRVDKLRRVVIEASKQCGRNVLMAVEPPVKWTALLARDWPRFRTVMHTSPNAVAWSRPSSVDAVVAIGPEGGFTEREIDAARERAWITASLGRTVLRVETAALAAAAMLCATDLDAPPP